MGRGCSVASLLSLAIHQRCAALRCGALRRAAEPMRSSVIRRICRRRRRRRGQPEMTRSVFVCAAATELYCPPRIISLARPGRRANILGVSPSFTGAVFPSLSGDFR